MRKNILTENIFSNIVTYTSFKYIFTLKLQKCKLNISNKIIQNEYISIIAYDGIMLSANINDKIISTHTAFAIRFNVKK